MGPRRRQSPKEYIRLALELHLNARTSDEGSAAAIETFLQSSSNRLFVWVPKKSQIKQTEEEEEEDYLDNCCASNDTLDGNNLGALAFVHIVPENDKTQSQQQSQQQQQSVTAAAAAASAAASSSESTGPTKPTAITASQIQCMTLQPRIYADEEEKESETTDDDASKATSEGGDKEMPPTSTSSSSNKTFTYDALQMYTRNVFVPAVQAMEAMEQEEEKIPEDAAASSGAATPVHEVDKSKKSRTLEGLEDKIRELDVALGQCKRSALSSIPNVILTVHPILQEASAKNPGKNPDWDALGLQEKLSDDTFLNQIQTGVSQWISQIRKVTVLPSTTSFPTVDLESSSQSADLEEISFWTQLEVALQNVQQELTRPDVELTLSLLKAAKRFLATIALENNTGLEGAMAHTTDVAHYVRNFPTPALEAARDFDKIALAVNSIFDHIPKVRSSRFYDLERCAKLVEATTLTLRRRMVGVLQEQYYGTAVLMLPYDEYERQVRYTTQDVFVQFDDRFDQFKEFFLDQGRRRRMTAASSSGTVKTPAQVIQALTQYHLPLKERLDAIHHFRVNHEKLRKVINEVLQGGDEDVSKDESSSAIREVESAPKAIFSTLDVLDLSVGGSTAFESALEEYDRKMDAMEEKLARLLRDKLTACQDAEDMFRVFARFNPLLTRTRVRAAVKEFQMQLISTVGEAVEKLQSKFTLKYESSSAAKISRLRGIPPVAGKILWAKQMERQVHALMKRMSDVLGPNWGQQLEGRQLRKSGDELLSKLDARAFFRAWVTEWEKELTASASARLNSYPIKVEHTGREGKLTAMVNFEEKNELLFREIRHLKWLGFDRDVPRTLSMVSEEAFVRYPYAMAIKTALRSYSAVRMLVTPELEPLVKPQLVAIRESVAEAFDVKLDGSKSITKKRRVRWDSKEMEDWVTSLTELVAKFEERVEQLLRACDKVDIALGLLEQVDYEALKFQGILRSIQKSIDKMSLSGYADLDSWVAVVDDRMGSVLSNRLDTALKAWSSTFNDKNGENSGAGDGENGEEKVEHTGKEKYPNVTIPNISVEILLRNQEISAVPAVPCVRSLFLKELHDFIGIVCSLPRPTSGRFEVFDSRTGKAAVEESEVATFDDLINQVDSKTLTKSYIAVEQHMKKLSMFVNQWFAYQTLWDTRVSDVAAAVGDNIEQWQNLLLEAADSRSTLDASTAVEDFGPVTVKYGKVQSQVILKYDSWQKELQSSFARVLADRMNASHEQISNAKNRLEGVSMDTSANTNDVVLGVTFIQEIKQKMVAWGKDLDKLIASERLLKRQRHIFGADWMEGSVVKGQYEHLEQILERRNRAMEQQIPLLQARVNAEDKASSKRVADLVGTWEQDKPLRGNVTPTAALEILTKFEFSMKKMNMDYENLIKAKDALGLEHSAEGNAVEECLQEMTDLKEVWDAVSVPYTTLDEIKDTPWSTAVPRKIRRALDDLLAEMRSLPNRIRQYDAYTHTHDAVKGFVTNHGMLSDLKTEALKERHWKKILQRLGIRVAISELTVGLLWDNGVLTRKKEMGEILTTAQGEMALEQFLAQVRDRWMKQELELVVYQNRVRLIRGWDDLFATLDDHMGGLVLMRSSPYYRSVREFQEEGKLWEDRLTKLRAAFDAWVDVQRRWVYLEGILFGSSDIKAQLPAEWSRFKSVDGEFISLMRRIANRPYAMEALNIENLQRTLERLGNLMSVIQRALGEYLEKQRRDFARFYFLGDDDLLEIIGNSGEPGKVLSHVGKMFAGIAGCRHDTSDLPEDVITKLDAMVSKDGEVVQLKTPIVVQKGRPVKDWLKELESQMKSTLALLLEDAVSEDKSSTCASNDEKQAFVEWAKKFPAQIMILAAQINWSMGVDAALHEDDSNPALSNVLKGLEAKLEVMAKTVLLDLPNDERKKFEQVITELVHQRDVTRGLIDDNVSSPTDFRWLYHLRYNYNPQAEKMTEKLKISLSNATFFYGFEYLGIGERLVQTPLTDKCYLNLTQALHFRMGGNPFGPAGTGKTESVKALGSQLGRFVLVMNCDETFDFGAMGRLFCGLCQVGAWGCFDEFNRLEERILSAVSQQILTIQRGLIERKPNIELLGKQIGLHDNVGIFVTMNPGYAGRSNLPDNLKTLFRSVAMVIPDRNLIAQVMLYSQGIVTAEQLSGKIVELFQLCDSRMSKQSHYDFGLRALKTLLISAGGLKRQALEGAGNVQGAWLATIEKKMLIVGACNNVVPKLVAEDLPVFAEVLEETFPGSEIAQMEDEKVRTEIMEICKKENYVAGDKWMQKILQLKQVIEMRHGVMLVGPCGVGKSSALNVLMQALEKVDGTKGDMYIIDPKAMNKENLYGSLDGTTMEWTDGVFTSLLRGILANQRGESDRRHWIVFDGDVDPEWAENLNSVLDDNKLLTLPSGERLGIPNNVRILLEVDSLAHATPATVSRCGMVWFSEDTVSTEMCLENLMGTLQNRDFLGDGRGSDELPTAQTEFLAAIKPMAISESRSTSLVMDAMEFALSEPHIMSPKRDRLLCTLSALLVQGIELAIEYDENHPDFPMTGDHMEKFAKRWMMHALLWAFSGSASWDVRKKFGAMLLRTSGISLPGGEDASVADYRVRVDDGEYELWSESVPRMEIASHRVSATDVVITTTDTVRHSDVLGAWLSSRKPLILCGPPGSGKTMTLTNVLQSLQGIVLASLNFSSRTTPEIILKTFTQYCSYVRRGKSIVLEPSESLGAQTWLVVFCDEINLPEEDTYGTQRVIMFMRQLVEQGGFWRDDNVWVKTNRIQFVGACNPPTDAGRVSMSERFLRHVPLLLVDFPSRDSLMQIYGTFNGGTMKLFPNLKGETEAMTEAMVEVYLENQKRFTAEMQPQYFYSPRELSRWVRGVYEAVVHVDGLTREELVRLWAHEALRLFCDRLVEESDREWCEETIDNAARAHFAGVDFETALARPLFYTSWLSKETRQVARNELKEFLAARLRVFYEEELDVPLVVFDEVLDHVLRLDRVLRQPMGHCLLVGDSGAGKTVLSKFVSWMNGLSIFQIKAHSRYSIEDFNEDLRGVMRRVGIEGEKVTFIFDEGNVLGSGFLEAMNALLASGEVPGLFEGDDYNALMSACRDSAARDGVILDTEEELWKRFTSIVQRNLHVVFTMNPSGGEWKNRATTSPALFNRCVVDWFGTWGGKAMGEVGKEFTLRLDIGDAESVGGTWGIGEGEELMKEVEGAFDGAGGSGLRQAVVATLVELHRIAKETAETNSASAISRTYLSPRDYLSLIQNFVDCIRKRRAEVEDEQLHVNAGLSKLVQTQENVAELKAGLGAKTAELREKEALANNKLQQMVADQKEAETSKEKAEVMNIEVEKQQIAINARKEEAQRELDEAEPALKSAQTSVRGIKKRDLDEIRNLARPPVNVKLTLECVAIMLGEKKIEWTDVRKLLAKADFIPNILNFDADKLSPKQIKLVKDKYLDGNKDLTAETVSRSSKACGPLYKWAESQIKYSSVYTRVQPLREEVEKLEQQAKTVKDDKEKIEAEVNELETSIAQYKNDYALLIRDVESLKSEMETVSKKVIRAESLIKSLSHESDRWSKSSEQFEMILRNLVGDGLLMAAFLTYSGFFDFQTRITLLEKWRNALDLVGIEYREDLGIVESLSKASDRLEWQSEGLPSDQLSLENGVILDHCIRFPLVIDPSGQAIDFIMKKYSDQKIQKTSFLDKAFMKTLAGAVRFGTTLLVENVEHVDPVMNPVLNREIQRTGGRSLVRIGTEDVDYSPKFFIILSTKNPAVQLTPDVCSRVTLVNFTVTPDSLQSQSMSHIVKAEKPEVEQQRTEILKLQGEQNVKLRELEDQMLAKISAVEGSILDDDHVVEGMEVLMKEGSQVEEQLSKSEEVMTQVHHAISVFEPLSDVCRQLFVLLAAMREISFLYEFSAKHFMTILKYVLQSKEIPSGSSEAERIASLKTALFQEVAARIGRGLMVDDKMVFAVLLARLYKKDDTIAADASVVSTAGIIESIEEIFGDDLPWQGRALAELKRVTEDEVEAGEPLMLCSAPGHDVSGRVEAMARENQRELAAVAMGSQEGFATADNFIATASKKGTWVMLKNCHLCTDWLRESLVKKLQSFGAGVHKDFRIFITSEINPKLPTALLRISDVIVAEAPSGVKATLSRFFTSISSERFHNPVRNRLYLILAWVHAVVQERLRYIPAGWTERYEFTEADTTHALDVIDSLVEDKKVDPDKLPWDAIQETFCKGVFGGRVTKPADQEVLEKLVKSIFVSKCFDVGFKLVDVDDSPYLPDGSSKEECFDWIDSLPSNTPPTWVGLDGSAEETRDMMIARSVKEKAADVGEVMKTE